MPKVTLTNSFHGTETTVIVDDFDPKFDSMLDVFTKLEIMAGHEQMDRVYGPSRRKLNRVRKSLCGVENCHCGIVR